MALHALRRDGVDPVGLLTTFGGPGDAVSHHGVPRDLLERQAGAAGLPVVAVALPDPCPNETYAARMGAALASVPGTTAVAFGDLFLADLRAWRETRLAAAGRAASFPLWGRDTGDLARGFTDDGFRATVCAVDTDQLDAGFVGRPFDASFLADLPASVDPCGEHGEFHTFVTHGPVLARPVPVVVTGTTTDPTGRFVHADLAAR
jgi:diphthamide synthase (EF-2-diphthine--ammonia ligase)